MEGTITISLEEYRNLVRDQERIECVKRFFEKDNFVNTKDIRIILGIEINEDDE